MRTLSLQHHAWKRIVLDRLSSSTRRLLSCALFASSAHFPALAASAAEGLPPTAITITLDDNYPPYVFRDDSEQLQGIRRDMWELWSKKTGIDVRLDAKDWGAALAQMAAGQADVIDTLFYTKERARAYDFSPPYAKIEVPIYFDKDIGGLSDAKSLRGFRIGVKEGDACIDWLRAQSIDTIAKFRSYEALVDGAANKDVRVFCMDAPPANYLLYRKGLQAEFRYTAPLYVGEFHWAVRKGNTALGNIVAEGFSKVSEAERKAIEERWLGRSLEQHPFAKYAGYALLLGGGAALALVVWTWSLRRQVATRTAEIQRLSRLYEALSRVNQAVARTASRDELFAAVCQVLVQHGGFLIAWIGWPDHDAKTLVPVAQSGDDQGYLRTITIHIDDRPEGHGPSGTAFREVRPYVCNDFFGDPATRVWWDAATERGIRASAALPIVREGAAQGTLTVYAAEIGFFQAEEISLLVEVAADLSLALDNLARTEERERAQALAQRERSFSDAMIDSMPGILYYYDEHGRFLRWNRNFEIVSGYSPEEIARMHPLDFFGGDEKKLIQARVMEVFESGQAFVEAAFVSKDGRMTPYFFTGRRVAFDGLNGLVGMGIDITERRAAQQALEDYAHRLQAMSRQLLDVQENERRVLARDLHDTVGQELTALSLNLAMIRSIIPPALDETAGSRLEDSQRLLEQTTQHLRNVMVELRPPGIDELGLLAALREHARQVARRSELHLVVNGTEPKPRFARSTAIALFRIVQEALNNTVKHAQASEIVIELENGPGMLRLTVADNGTGFDVRRKPSGGPHGMGMTTMRERAEAIGARLRVESEIGHGTRIVIEIPHPVPPTAS